MKEYYYIKYYHDNMEDIINVEIDDVDRLLFWLKCIGKRLISVRTANEPAFKSYSPVGYANEAIGIIENGIKLIEEMQKDEDYEEPALRMLIKDKERLNLAKETLYEVLRDCS